MATEKRLIDANEAYEIARTSGLHNDFAASTADLTSLREVLEDCSTIDAVEVVRCKECNWHTVCQAPSVMFCKKYNTFMAEDDFCSYGERKNNG